MNAPATFDSFLLYEGDKKVELVKDTKIPQAVSFTIHKEDHTLANLLKSQLLKDSRVVFCGYRVPHPMEYHFILRVQTNSTEYSPVDALQNAITELIGEVTMLESRFKDVAKAKREMGD
ncbi:hypothetical protein GJ496_010977 [Pomphorhynchus laevis]|nr:hypothetical protein GJ496_010977 [Pomphorhynchus laevis]